MQTVNKLTALTGTYILATSLFAQGGGTWTPVIDHTFGWANLTGNEIYPAAVRPARAIHLIHLRPTNPAMGNTGKFLFWGRSTANDCR